MACPPKTSNDTSNENPIVFLDIAINTEIVGRVIIELYKNVVPKTAENFRALCTGEKGIGVNGKKLCYKGSIFHKILPQYMIQGGDIINFNGTSGESIYGPHFEDENFNISHYTEGLLSSVNAGRPNTNSSQFIITLDSCTHLDNTNVVFGKVVKGMGIIKEIQKVELKNDAPVQKLYISNCGELKNDDDWGLIENDGTEDIYTPYPEDWEFPQETEKLSFTIIDNIIRIIKDSGNTYFMKKDYVRANKKYDKALRYYNWMMKLEEMPDRTNEKVIDLKVIILLNLAAVKLKQNDYRTAVRLCNEVIDLNNKNSKALFRRGQAHMGLNEHELGLADLRRALSVSPNNKDIVMEIKKAQKTMRSYLILRKAECKRMFQ